jgi:hypothetical protein
LRAAAAAVQQHLQQSTPATTAQPVCQHNMGQQELLGLKHNQVVATPASLQDQMQAGYLP